MSKRTASMLAMTAVFIHCMLGCCARHACAQLFDGCHCNVFDGSCDSPDVYGESCCHHAKICQPFGGEVLLDSSGKTCDGCEGCPCDESPLECEGKIAFILSGPDEGAMITKRSVRCDWITIPLHDERALRRQAIALRSTTLELRDHISLRQHLSFRVLLI